MKKRDIYATSFAFLGLLILILDGETALRGARESMDLVLYTVIPSLFPFFFLSILLSSFQGSGSLPFLRPLARLFQLPGELSYLLLPAFLGGYPSGAQAVTVAWEQGALSKENAQRLLGFCSNAGPSFIFGILGPMFPEKWVPWVLWLSHILGAMAVSSLFPVSHIQDHGQRKSEMKTIREILISAITVTVQVCGWVILFRILLSFLNQWVLWLLPKTAQILLSGLLELTNGCCGLDQIGDFRLRAVISAAMLSAGGFCVTMQTRSVTGLLSIRYYICGKMIQTLVSVCIIYALMYRRLIFGIVPMMIYGAAYLKLQKRCRFLISSGV